MMCQGCGVLRCTVLCFAKSEWASKLHTAVLDPYYERCTSFIRSCESSSALDLGRRHRLDKHHSPRLDSFRTQNEL